MNQNGLNNITKEMALQWMRVNRNIYSTEHIIQLIYKVTVLGSDYTENGMDPYMSYICRAFNITAYGVSKQQNRIKGRYGKYREKSDIRNVITQIIKQYPNGFKSESPRFDDLLKDYYSSNVNVRGSASNRKQNEVRVHQTQGDSFGANNSYYQSVEYTGHGGDGESTGMELIYVIGVFSIALLVRWFFSGTIWGAWYRKILTILTAFFAFGGLGAVFIDLDKPYNSSKKSGMIFLIIVSVALAVYSVCSYPGNWIPRIIAGILSAVLSMSVSAVLENK